MMNALDNSGAMPVLKRLLQFSGARHRLITDNIANLSTPGFRPKDVPVAEFQRAMREAVDARRGATPENGLFEPADTEHISFDRGGVRLSPVPSADNVLFHDGGDRNVERTMQNLVENFMVFRQASELIRSRYALLNTAIRERM
jgi:flagellar basal-body rod protein FlgB